MKQQLIIRRGETHFFLNVTYECSLCFCLKFSFGLQRLCMSAKPKVLKLIDLANPFNSEGQFVICMVPPGSKLFMLIKQRKTLPTAEKTCICCIPRRKALN